MPARTLPLSALLTALPPHRPRVGRAVCARQRAKDSQLGMLNLKYLLRSGLENLSMKLEDRWPGIRQLADCFDLFGSYEPTCFTNWRIPHRQV